MKVKTLFSSMIVLLLATSCSRTHFISDKEYRTKVEKTFVDKKAAMPNGQFFNLFKQKLSLQEREAMKFMYAYNSLADITNYSDTFFLKGVRLSLQAKREMPWGKEISEELFRHFVLPIRVNNETLDNSREVFYNELKGRVKNLSLHDAILEVNHWCHEKVVYTPSDARTSSPLASVRTAYGRCGEESTFLVAALRSVGIPARQVYTPRWAHTDDNHAWVEAWADGKWYFLGACEPEPMLNVAWFSAPARRGMLMHTNVAGLYSGAEEIMRTTPNFTEINVINNYAPTDRIDITILGADKQPLEDALVEYKIYNYGEFYTVARKQTDKSGHSFLSAGKGDLLIWASKDGKFAFRKVSIGKDRTLTLVLDKTTSDRNEISLDIIPPAESAVTVNVTAEQRAMNNIRMAHEDSIRNAYISTFISDARITQVANQLSINVDRTKKLFIASRGNWDQIEKFLLSTNSQNRERALDLLEVISAKDLRDTQAEVLIDHLQYTLPTEGDIFNRYVLNPRVSDEFLTAYKQAFLKEIPSQLVDAIRANPSTWVNWCRENITIREELNSNKLFMSPMGVWKARVTDSRSRKVFFVAVLRSLGIPARIETVTGKTQYYQNDSWMDVDFDNFQKGNAAQGTLTASYNAISSLKDPIYYKNFTLAKIEDGKSRLLEFDESEKSTWSTILSEPLKLDVGQYMLVTGNRMADGSVLSNVTFFRIEEGKNTAIELKIREDEGRLAVLGSFNSEETYINGVSGLQESILGVNGRGYYAVAIIRNNHEPSNHALRDLAAKKDQLEQWGKKIFLLFPDEAQWKAFDTKAYGELPSNVVFGIDKNGSVLKQMREGTEALRRAELPAFIIGDTFNRVVFTSQGYRIGLGEQLLKVIRKL